MKMENWEIQSMKDDLYNLGYELEGTRDGDTVKKAWEYINDLEKNLVKVANSKERAKKILIEEGYVVTKLTKGQLEDARKCEECGFEGDCFECRCSICIVQ